MHYVKSYILREPSKISCKSFVLLNLPKGRKIEKIDFIYYLHICMFNGSVIVFIGISYTFSFVKSLRSSYDYLEDLIPFCLTNFLFLRDLGFFSLS